MSIFSPMHHAWTLLSLVPILSSGALAKSPEWEKFPAPTESTDASSQWLPLDLTSKAGLVSDTAKQTRLLGFFPASPLESYPSLETALNAGSVIFSDFKNSPPLTVNFEWLGNDVLEDRGHSVHEGDGRFRSVYRVRSTTIFRTVLASKQDGVIYVHFHADQPGALSFKTTISSTVPSVVRVEDRRQLILAPIDHAPNHPAAHIWVIPYESDVSGNDDSISLMGEGEALIVFAFGSDGKESSTLAKTWEQIGERYDPGHTPPNPSKVWQGVLEAHQKSAKNSP